MEPTAVNDVNITLATVNGTGSASANALLFKALFRMGLPCVAKNYFPSNIQGLPTWYQIRVSAQGYLCRREATDLMVAFNKDTLLKDLPRVRHGGVVVYNTEFELPPANQTGHLHLVGLPVDELVRERIPTPQLRPKVANMIYVGAVARLLDMPFEVLEEALRDTFGAKPAVLEPNRAVIEAGYRHVDPQAARNWGFPTLKAIPEGNKGKMVAEGNTAAALGAIFGGVNVVAWYPITPSTSIVEDLAGEIGRHRKDEEGRNRYAIIQTEDELASIHVAVGAGWSGARAMTATSGPGLSLMQEGIGLGYFTESPCVIFNVQRAGPSTGLPTRTQQSDLSLMHQGSHGDTRHIVLIPHDNPSIFEMGWRAFDYADRYQTPVLVMMDLDLGMNIAISEPFKYPDTPMDRGKLLDEAAIQAQGGQFHRYKDIDGDGICQRTIPGNRHPAAPYFTRGTAHDDDARYSEDAVQYQALLDRLRRKYETARGQLPPPLESPPPPLEGKAVEGGADGPVGLLCFGSNAEACREAVAILAHQGLAVGRLVVRALPLHQNVLEFCARYPRVYVMESNRDGQMAAIIKDDYPEVAAKLRHVRIYNGLPATAAEIARQLMKQERP